MIRGLKAFFPVKSGLPSRAESYVQAINGIDLTTYRGKTLELVGESGCGRTTLGKTILQLYKPTVGEMIYEFEDGSYNPAELKKDEMDMARKKIQIVFQDPQSSLNPSFTIYRFLPDLLKRFGVKTEAERRKAIGGLLEVADIRRKYMDCYPYEFSEGQRQRIGIARVLCINPEFVICDEAVSALDISIQAQVLQLLRELKEKYNLTYIFITHNLSVVEYISDRIAVMYLSRVVELADVDGLYQRSIHPYIQAPLFAIPVADISHKEERTVLKGDVPSPMNPPSGCHFHGHCRICQETYKKEKPKLQKHITEGREHFVVYHLAKENIEACAVSAESM